jgi:hypothetical protein
VWASQRLWDRRQWTAAIVTTGKPDAAYIGQVLAEAQQIACLPDDLLRVCIGWEPAHFTGLPGLHFAVVPDGDRIAPDSDLERMIGLSVQAGVIRRMVALSGADRPPSPWFAQFEQPGRGTAGVTW